MKNLIFLIFAIAMTASAQSNPSPHMSLPIPIPGITPGPIWAQDINSSFLIIDSHNHTPGHGVQVPPSGININSDLTFNNNNAVSLRTSRYSSQGSVLTTPSDIGEIYVVGNELYYNDVTGGNRIQITNNGSVNAGAGSISGLPSGTASAAYLAGTFVWQSATNTAANLDARNIILRNSSANSKGLTLQPPSAMGANISETLPTIPGSVTSIMQMDTSGNMTAALAADGTTINNSGTVLSVATQGITNAYLGNNSVTASKIVSGTITSTQIAAGGVLTTNIADGNVTRPKLVAVGQQISSSSASFTTSSTTFVDVTNLSISITTTGRPVMLIVQAKNATSGTAAIGENTVGGGGAGLLKFVRTSTTIGTVQIPGSTGGVSDLGDVVFLDVPSAGTYTYKIQAEADDPGAVLFVTNCVLAAYEL